MKISKSKGNVFADLGFKDSEARDLAVKSDLITLLTRAMEGRQLSQSAAAKICGTDQPTLSKVLNGQLQSVTIDRLARWLVALGSSVNITVAEPKPHKGLYQGSIRVQAD
jgi:predicted XRE-type DNA-binding protein